MYVTRRISEFRKNPELYFLWDPTDGPNSGYLVIKDEEEPPESCCFGLFIMTTRVIDKMPFPQNMDLTLEYSIKSNSGDGYKKCEIPMVFIPVLNQPLSSNLYYAIQPQQEHKGKALISSKGANRRLFPEPLNPQNVYQHMEIVPRACNHFDAKSVASDGFRPHLLPPKEWLAYPSTPYHFELHDARGIDSALRAHLPNFNLSMVCKSSKPVIVGTWYVPFMFVKDGRLRDQFERSMYYHVTLEQRWEQIFTCKKNIDDGINKGNLVEIDVEVEKQEVFIAGNKALWSEKNAVEGVIWFTSYETEGGDLSVGLRVEVVERMKWEQERGGWKAGKEWKERVKRVEEFNGKGDWKEFGCYVLVERFNLRRMDGSLAMAYDFKHIHQIKVLWE